VRIVEGYQAAKAALARAAASGEIEAREWTVREIVDKVRAGGDRALFDYTEKFDGVKIDALEVSRERIDKATDEIDPELRKALQLAERRITAFHEEQKRALGVDSAGKKLGWVMRPLGSVGVHAPGFQAPLPSSVLMTAVPARVAGVKEIILVTPPGKSGSPSPVTLAAAGLAGVSRVFSVGGAQAVAALAYGTETVPRVDKVCGPGNIYVTLAKKIVFGDVGIDGLYGPSEVVVIADDTARPDYIAADLLGQAEHGSGATAILITNSKKLAEAVNAEVEQQISTLVRSDVARESVDGRGLIAVVESLDEALDLANGYAPEHLCLVVKDAEKYVDKVENAGCLFIGENSLEVLVDYVAGPSHVLPTGGTARFSATLNVTDFMKIMTVVRTDAADLRELGGAAATIARAEGLDAHARAVERRLGKGRGK
jgi:histidinol dehydrogenase